MTNLDEKKTACKMTNFYISIAFLLITIALLIAVSIYCYLIKKHLSPFHVTKNKLKNIKKQTYFDLNNLKLDENSYKIILIYFIVNVTIKDSKYVKICSEILLFSKN